MKQVAWVFILVGMYMSGLNASAPKFKIYTSSGDFERGKLKGVSLTSTGEIKLAPVLDSLFTSTEPAIWDMVVDDRGTVYFSAGNKGQIYRLDAKGKASPFATLPEVEVYCLALDGQGRLYAGTSPDGKVYRIDTHGNAASYFDPSNRYIWDLLFDSRNNLYVATGDSGIIYRVSDGGKASVYYQSEEQHIRCLAWDNNKQLLAGSYGNGYVYRITKSGQAFVLHDANLKEISHIEVAGNGIIYASALGKDYAGPGAPSPTTKMTPSTKPSAEVKNNNKTGDEVVIGEIKIEAPRAQPKSNAVSQSAMLKIFPNGNVKNIWDSFNDHIQTFTISPAGELIVGTGAGAKLVAINNAEEKSILLDLEESQISVLTYDRNRNLHIATANMGNLYRVTPQYRTRGEYQSEVFDSFMPTTWGSISWEETLFRGTDIQLYTRSGNTESPNSTWTEWSPAYHNANGENIRSEDARFIQWKAVLHGAKQQTPLLKEVSIAYLQKNMPPEIMFITIYPAGEYYQGAERNIKLDNKYEKENNSSGSLNSGGQNKTYLGRKSYQQGIQTVSWDVDDQNDDRLAHFLYYREEHEKTWKKLATDWYTSSFAWDTKRFPDGRYYLKLVVNDSLSNPVASMYQVEKISEPFIIDNSGPVIQFSKPSIENQTVTITATVKDTYHPIREVYYALDGQDWQRVFPKDGINDSKQEVFTIKSKVEGRGSHILVLKAVDTVNNYGFSNIRFED